LVAGLASPASTTPQADAPPGTPPVGTTATQLAQAAAQVHVAPGATGSITIRLHPADLGGVQIQITRAPTGGGASITIQVEKPETLQTLQLDTSHLHQALDRAGLATEGRVVSLHLAPQGADSAGNGGSSLNAGAHSGPNSGTNSGTNSGANSGGNQGQDRAPQPRHATQTGVLDLDAAPEPHSTRWQQAGVNITA